MKCTPLHKCDVHIWTFHALLINSVFSEIATHVFQFPILLQRVRGLESNAQNNTMSSTKNVSDLSPTHPCLEISIHEIWTFHSIHRKNISMKINPYPSPPY